MVYKIRWMLEVDFVCICVNFNDGEFKWDWRRELYEVVDFIEIVMEIVFCNFLNEIEISFLDGFFGLDNMFDFLEKFVVGDDNLLWCDCVCVYEKVDMDSVLWCNML